MRTYCFSKYVGLVSRPSGLRNVRLRLSIPRLGLRGLFERLISSIDEKKSCPEASGLLLFHQGKSMTKDFSFSSLGGETLYHNITILFNLLTKQHPMKTSLASCVCIAFSLILLKSFRLNSSQHKTKKPGIVISDLPGSLYLNEVCYFTIFTFVVKVLP